MKKEYPDILKLEGEKWHNPDPATGKLGTRVPAEWLQTTEDSLKSLTLEMLEVLKAAGINPNELNNTQVRDAIQGIVLEKAGAPSTITASTKNSVTQSSHTHEIAKATTSQQGIVQLTNTIDTSQDKAITPFAVNELQKLLQEALRQAIPVGFIANWPCEIAPNEDWLIMRGQKYSKDQYQELYSLLKTDTLPDGRGVMLRGLDANRGFDPGRTLLSYQEDAMQKITGGLYFGADDGTSAHIGKTLSSYGALRAFVRGYNEIHKVNWSRVAGSTDYGVAIDSSLVSRTNSQNETVSKNLALNIIIKVK